MNAKQRRKWKRHRVMVVRRIEDAIAKSAEETYTNRQKRDSPKALLTDLKDRLTARLYRIREGRLYRIREGD